MSIHTTPSLLDSIKKSLVALKMPRALEMLDATVRRIEQGEIDAIEALDQLLVEELTLRDNRRIKTSLMMARLSSIKTLAGFDFAFQPSLDRNRILALAELKFIDRAEVVHLLGPPGTGKSHLATALAVEAVKAGRSVAFSTLADIIASLVKAEREGQLSRGLRRRTLGPFRHSSRGARRTPARLREARERPIDLALVARGDLRRSARRSC